MAAVAVLLIRRASFALGSGLPRLGSFGSPCAQDCFRSTLAGEATEVSIMVEPSKASDHDKSVSSGRFRKLPERIRPEDMIATQETEPPPDPTMGRDSERDFMLRNAGF